jgi:hypothetical protein
MATLRGSQVTHPQLIARKDVLTRQVEHVIAQVCLIAVVPVSSRTAMLTGVGVIVWSRCRALSVSHATA